MRPCGGRGGGGGNSGGGQYSWPIDAWGNVLEYFLEFNDAK